MTSTNEDITASDSDEGQAARALFEIADRPFQQFVAALTASRSDVSTMTLVADSHGGTLAMMNCTPSDAVLCGVTAVTRIGLLAQEHFDNLPEADPFAIGLAVVARAHQHLTGTANVEVELVGSNIAMH